MKQFTSAHIVEGESGGVWHAVPGRLSKNLKIPEDSREERRKILLDTKNFVPRVRTNQATSESLIPQEPILTDRVY